MNNNLRTTVLPSNSSLRSEYTVLNKKFSSQYWNDIYKVHWTIHGVNRLTLTFNNWSLLNTFAMLLAMPFALSSLVRVIHFSDFSATAILEEIFQTVFFVIIMVTKLWYYILINILIYSPHYTRVCSIVFCVFYGGNHRMVQTFHNNAYTTHIYKYF